MCLISYANNKGADQPAHLRSLISAFVVRCLDSIISLNSIAEISRLASFCGCAGRFVSGLVGNSQRHVLSCCGSFYIYMIATECVLRRQAHLGKISYVAILLSPSVRDVLRFSLAYITSIVLFVLRFCGPVNS